MLEKNGEKEERTGHRTTRAIRNSAAAIGAGQQVRAAVTNNI